MKQWVNSLAFVLVTAAIFATNTSAARADLRIEVLTRGPIHEAFAQPVTFDEGAGFAITRQPPAPLEEMIPEQKPEGNHVLWIPGYWNWDTDRSDFIWISGCWRAVPPNCSWIPGYWATSAGGYQWVAGFWSSADTEEIEYLPAPPATLEAGPQGASSSNNIWIPGCWVRQEGRYAWRAGFWEAGRANWVWVPSQYCYTPLGYVYVDGYWDYALKNRGVMFLPVYCPAELYGQAGFQFAPDIVFNIDVLSQNLFCCPQRHHYYFGDYYGADYAQQGYNPWCDVSVSFSWYDPLFVHAQWQHRDDHQWAANQRTGYEQRRDNVALRPARTYAALQVQIAGLPRKQRNQPQMARPLKEAVAAKNAPFKFETVDAYTRTSTASQAKDAQSYKVTRSQWESPKAAPAELPTQPREILSQKVKISRSSTRVNGPVSNKSLMPPPRPKHPTPDPNVQPKEKKENGR